MKKFKEQIKIIFNQTKEISCPAFNGEKVYFNAKGVNHLIYKGSRSRRDEKRIKTNIRKNKITFKFWAFEAIIDDRRIKAIVRQVGQGRKHFWSVIPAWRKDRFGIVNAKRRKLEA